MALTFTDIESNNGGVVVSWENLDVSTKPTLVDKIKSGITRKPQSKTLLNKVTGVVQPGQMVALMGARYAMMLI